MAGERTDRSDRGGMSSVAALVRETLQPVILTAIDSRPLTKASQVFRSGVVRIRFYPVREENLQGFLHHVAGQEHMALGSEALTAVARHAKGDVRAALNDLEVAGALPAGSGPSEVLGWRDMDRNLFEATDEFLSAGRVFRIAEILERVQASPDDLLPWIEENLPYFARTPSELAQASAVLARAQLHLQRANRQRVFSLWSYASELMTGGVSVALHPHGPSAGHHPRVEFPRFLWGMSSSRGARGAREGMVAKLGQEAHVSRHKARDEVLPYLERLFRETHAAHGAQALEAQHRFQSRLVQELKLDAKDLSFLLRVDEDHPSIHHLLQPAKPPGAEAEPEPEKKPGPRGQQKLF